MLHQVLVDHLLDRHVLAVRLDGARFLQFSFTLPHPSLRRGLPVERLAFLINCLPFLHNANLGGEARKPVLALALRDGSHEVLHECLRLLHCSNRSSKTGKNRNKAATIRD